LLVVTTVPLYTVALLRWETSLIGWKRKARSDVVLADGSVIPAGRQIVALIGAANRDPAVFDDPDAIRPGRNVAGNALHTFGIGPYVCVGSGLATLELELSLRALRQQFPGLRLAAGNGQRGYAPDCLFRMPRSVDVA
jgi:cytochrome P450